MSRCRIALLSSLTLLLAGAAPPARAADAKPNVIVVLADDQGYGDFSCHGNPVLKTPNLDKLHAESVRLTDFHVAPMCSPTRGQLMSGVDGVRNGATSVTAGRMFLRRGIPTMADVFKANGYRTGHFGKWHLGDTYPYLPHQRGFDEAVYHLGFGVTSIAEPWENDCFDPRYYHNGVLTKYKGYCTDIWFDLASSWIKERAAKKEPFFVYLPTNAPHGPHWCPEKYKKPYEGKGPAGFFGMIANIDENLGKLDALLKDLGVRDNTIILYMNDNGGTAGVRLFNAGMRGAKTQYYDGGHRAACFVRWPAGKLRKPSDIDALSHVQDILPTLVELCDLRAPKEAKFDGVSLAGLLKGTQETLPDRMCVVQYGQKPEKGDCCVMWNKWRLVKGKELYDLKTDPGQMKDVADKNPDVLKKMTEFYDKWWAGVEKLVDDFSPISVGSDKQNPVCLTAAEWANEYCDNMNNLREGVKKNGPWHLLVEQDGEYEVALRRWPKEADAVISAGVPAFKGVDGGLPEGKALPVAKVRLKVAGLDETKAVGAKDKEVVFTVKLKAGTKLPMQSWCYDADGKELCGAYFAYVRRK
jgi:arylsulfatase